jgi:hypothetical protein
MAERDDEYDEPDDEPREYEPLYGELGLLPRDEPNDLLGLEGR